MKLLKKIGGWLGLSPGATQSPAGPRRGRVDHVIILDGTMSSLKPGYETNAGLTYRLLAEVAPATHLSLRYEAGVQWRQWRHTLDVIRGTGINRQIRRAYGFLASRYRPGDRIFLIGYSRGAYAVRSLAGVIDTVGLLKPEHATERNIKQAYRHYECSASSDAAKVFTNLYCHDEVEIEMVGVWDTVKALGFRAPLIWMLYEQRHAFHNHTLGPLIKHGYHALAMDETREVYAPVLWECPENHHGRVEQVWFRGGHADVGGQLDDFLEARPLSNIPLVWMLEKAEALGLDMPEGWRERFPTDPDAPAIGTWHGWGKFFVARKKRVIGLDPSESIHETAKDRRPKARVISDNLFEWQKNGVVKPRWSGFHILNLLRREHGTSPRISGHQATLRK